MGTREADGENGREESTDTERKIEAMAPRASGDLSGDPACACGAESPAQQDRRGRRARPGPYHAHRLVPAGAHQERGLLPDASDQYDANGNRIRVTHPDGGYFTYDYDGMNRATAIRENGATLVAMLGYDDLGRRATLARGGGVATTGYGYDGASRLSCLTHDLAGGGAPACAGNVAGGSDYLAGFVSSPAGQIVSRTVAARPDQ